VDSAEKPEDIDRVRAQEAKERAQERLRQKESLKEYKQSEASLARALTRLRVTEKI
jgi:F-type H+-transporting ATPase subunit epsilon